MMTVIVALLMTLSLQGGTTPDPAPGVPLEVAEDRAARISNLRYEPHFVIPAVIAEPVRGRVTIRFDLKKAARGLVLDFAGPADALGRVTANGREARVRWVNEHIVVAGSDLRDGANELALEFRSADAPLNRNAEFLYALFVPARARQAFPCFDQPDLKAKYTLSVDIPEGWEALSNGAPAGRDGTTVRFAEAK